MIMVLPLAALHFLSLRLLIDRTATVAAIVVRTETVASLRLEEIVLRSLSLRVIIVNVIDGVQEVVAVVRWFLLGFSVEEFGARRGRRVEILPVPNGGSLGRGAGIGRVLVSGGVVIGSEVGSVTLGGRRGARFG